jgi:predicted metal-dependent hydrolase
MRSALFRRTDPSHLEIRHGSQSFRIALRRRPTARRMTLRVSSVTGEVVLTLPERVDLVVAKRFADGHGGWIASRLARVPERVAFVDGASLPVRGVVHRVAHRGIGGGATAAVIDGAGHPVIAVSGEAPHVPRRVREFLEREARRDLVEAVKRYTAAAGVPARKITVRDTKSRWGSCSARGCLSFSWRLILAPSFVLDYLAAHEVAHLVELNHSRRFWRLLHKLCPHTEEAERWLKRHGAELHKFG